MRTQTSGILALAVLGGYLVYRNRFNIQRFLEARGIDLPLSTRNVKDFVRSGAAKISGSAEHELNQTQSDIRSVG